MAWKHVPFLTSLYSFTHPLLPPPFLSPLPVEEDIVANLLLRYTRDHNTVRSIRREYRLMVNEPMDAVDAAAEIKCRFTASKLARLLKEQMEYVNSCCQSKVGPTLLSQRAGRS